MPRCFGEGFAATLGRYSDLGLGDIFDFDYISIFRLIGMRALFLNI
jgi:hypothetical protein